MGVNDQQQVKVPVYKNLWLWALVVLVLIIVAMGIFIMRTRTPSISTPIKVSTPPATTISTKQPTSQKVSPFTQQDLENIDAEWSLLGQEPITLDNNDYTAVVMVDGIYGGTGLMTAQVRISVFENKNNQWCEIWHTPRNIEAPCFIDSSKGDAAGQAASQLIRDFIVLHDGKGALAIANIPTVMGSAHGDSEVVAVTIDSSGNCNLQAMDASGIMIVKQIDDQHANVTGEGAYGIHEMYLQDGQFQQKITPLSQMAPPQSIQAKFIVGSDGTVYPADTPDLTVHVGQTVAFVPANMQAESLFNAGKIDIFTNTFTTDGPSPTPPPIVVCQAYRMKEGNSATFDKTGVFQFLLISDDQWMQYSEQGNITQPTFTVVVQP